MGFPTFPQKQGRHNIIMLQRMVMRYHLKALSIFSRLSFVRATWLAAFVNQIYLWKCGMVQFLFSLKSSSMPHAEKWHSSRNTHSSRMSSAREFSPFPLYTKHFVSHSVGCLMELYREGAFSPVGERKMLQCKQQPTRRPVCKMPGTEMHSQVPNYCYKMGY